MGLLKQILRISEPRFQVWDEEGYVCSEWSIASAKCRADREHRVHGSYAVVYQSAQVSGRPPDVTIVYRTGGELADRSVS